MKGLAALSVFAFFYVLIIIIFNEAAGEPRGFENPKNIGQPTNSGGTQESEQPSCVDCDPKDKAVSSKNGTKNATSTSVPSFIFGHVATEHLSPLQKDGSPSSQGSNRSMPEERAVDPSHNDTNPLADLFQIGDPTMRTALGAVYGSYKGNDQCSRKAFCMMGNYLKDMPGRDLVFMFMGNYIPSEYSLYYDIFKAAVVYGQNCSVYVCVPDANHDDSNNGNAAASARPKSTPPPTSTGGVNTTPPR